MTAGALLAVLVIAPGLIAQMAAPPDPQNPKTKLSAQVEGRKKFLALVLDSKDSTADFLKSCADGKEVGKVRDARASGDPAIPDASETCPLVTERAVNNGVLLDYYRKLVADGNGDVTPQQALKSTAATASKNQSIVAIGNGKGFRLTGSQAFTAGVATGALDSSVTLQSLGLPAASPENEDKINNAATACLDGGNPNPPAASACSRRVLSALSSTDALRRRKAINIKERYA